MSVEVVLAGFALAVAVVIAVVMIGAFAAGAVVVLAGLCGCGGWLVESYRLNREENAK